LVELIDPQARRLRNSRRRALVLVLVQVLLLAHIAHWLLTGSSLAPLEPSEASRFAREKVINPGLIVLGVAIASTLLFGRFFCGWACHFLAVQDGCAWILRRLKVRVRPLRSRALRIVPIMAFVWMFLVPLYSRISSGDVQHTSSEWVTESFWKTFPGPAISIITFLIAGCYVVYLLGNKAFCNYACPYGAILGASDSFSVGRIVVDPNLCNSCMVCTKVCSSDVIVHQEIKEFGAVVDNKCMKTLDCVASCPNQALSFQLAAPAVLRSSSNPNAQQRHPLSLTEEVVLALGFCFGFFATHDLFGAVPFLLALGFGLVAAHSALALKKKHLSLKKSKVKYTAHLLALVFFAHSGLVQSQSLMRDHYFDQTFDMRMAYLRGKLALPLKPGSSQNFLLADGYASRTAALSYAGFERNDYVHAWRHLAEGNNKLFEEYMLSVLDYRPGFGEVIFQLGIHYGVQGDNQQAIELMQQITAGDAKYADAQEYIEKIGSHLEQH
jgi:polyferredoxin